MSNSAKLEPETNLTAAKVDVLDEAALTAQLANQGAVICAFSGRAQATCGGTA